MSSQPLWKIVIPTLNGVKGRNLLLRGAPGSRSPFER